MTEKRKNREQFEDRRQRRIKRRRGRILSAAAQVFSKKGYPNATMKEIADQADMAEGTLYNYFDGKRDILLSIAHEMDTPMVEALLEVEGLEDRAAIIALLEKALHISEARLPFIQALLSEAWVDDDLLQEFVIARSKQIHQLLETYIAERITAGVFCPMDPALTARLVMGMYGGLILPAVRGVAPLPSPEERHALAEAVADMLLDGVRAR